MTGEEAAAGAVPARFAVDEKLEKLFTDMAERRSVRNHLSSFEDARCLIETVEQAVEMERITACVCNDAGCNCGVLKAEFDAVTAFLKQRREALEKARTEYLGSKGLKVEDFP